jgi:hypothetical protein
MKILILTFFSILSLISCSNNDDDDISVPNNNSNFVPINITPILIGNGVLYGDGAEGIIQSNVVISDSVQWQNLLNQMNSINNVSNSFSEISIDFTQYQIIAVFDNIYGDAGHNISISSIIENVNNINVTVQSVYVINVFAIQTQPYYIVKIPKSTKPVIFQ